MEEGEIVCECDHLTNFGLLLVSQPNWFTPSHFNPFHSLSLFPPFPSPYLNPFNLSPSLPPLGNQPPPPRYGAPSGNYHLRCPHFVHRLPAYHHHYLPYNKVRAVEERKERGKRGEGEGRGKREGRVGEGRGRRRQGPHTSQKSFHTTHTHTGSCAHTCLVRCYYTCVSLCSVSMPSSWWLSREHTTPPFLGSVLLSLPYCSISCSSTSSGQQWKQSIST